MRTREDTKAWVQSVLTYLELKPTQLARKIGVVPSTLNKFMNSLDATNDLSKGTVEAIAEVAGVEPYEQPGLARRRGFSEPDAQPFETEGSGDANIDIAVRALAGGGNGVDPWVLRSRALELAGYFPGDVMIMDLNARPKAGDIVCAQVYDWAGGKAETVFRQFFPPYLVGASLDQRFLKPLLVDDDHVIIRAVMIGMMRPRASRSLAA